MDLNKRIRELEEQLVKASTERKRRLILAQIHAVQDAAKRDDNFGLPTE